MSSNDVLKRYQQAQDLMDGITSKKMVINDAVFSHWIGDTDCFWYRRDTVAGKEYCLVDAKVAGKALAFDHAALAGTLGNATGKTIDPLDLPILVTGITQSPITVAFSAFDKEWLFDAKQTVCHETRQQPAVEGIVSPNQEKSVFIRDHNIWIKDLSSGNEQALTKDGASDYRYGKAFVPCRGTAPLEAIWSPDSQYLFTYQLDQRGVRTRKQYLPVPKDGGIEPDFFEQKLSYPDDEAVETYRLVVIKVDSASVCEVDYPPLFPCRFSFEFFSYEQLGWWSSNSETAYFVDMTRDSRAVRVMALDPLTGNTRLVFEETSDTPIRLSHNIFPEAPLFMPLPETEELIWYSERDGWGHFYLYDMNTGALKNRITEGEWVNRQRLHFNAEKRELYVQTSGRNPDISPYYQDICLINIDSGHFTPLATGNYEHMNFGPDNFQTLNRVFMQMDSPGINGIAPSGNYLVATRSRVDTLPVSVLIDREGKERLILEEAQAPGLPADWVWPEPVTVKAADGETDLCGVIFRPPGFSPDKNYPVLDYSYTVPYSSSLPQGAFTNGLFDREPYFVSSAYAALGFVVVYLEVRGTPCRSKAFQDVHYGRIASANGFDDRLTGIRQLAERYPYMDLDRVGIASYDGATGPVYGLLECPEFYKVGVNVDFDDPRFGIRSMVEMYEGIAPVKKPYNDELLSNLEGKLIVTHGLRGSSPPETTLQLVEALQKLNKDFEMVLEPNGIHTVSSYTFRKTWDCLVRHLLELEPPKDFRIVSAMERTEEYVQKFLDDNPHIEMAQT